MNTKDGYAKKSLTNVNILGAGGGDISLLNLKGIVGDGSYIPTTNVIVANDTTNGCLLSTIKLYTYCSISFKFSSLYASAACGLADAAVANMRIGDDTNHFAWVCDGTNVKYKVPGAWSSPVTVTSDDVFSVEYINGFVIFKKNKNIVYVYPDPSTSNGISLDNGVKGWFLLYNGGIEEFECNAFPTDAYISPYLQWTNSNATSAPQLQPNTIYSLKIGTAETLFKTSNSLLKSGGTMTGSLTVPSLSVTGAATFSQAINSSILGNAATASRLQNSRTISLTGPITGSASFDGSNNASIATTLRYAGDSAVGGILTGYVDQERKMAVKVYSGNAFVHVPITDTNTTYLPGTNISIVNIETTSNYVDWTPDVVVETIENANTYMDITVNQQSTVPTTPIIVRFVPSSIIKGTTGKYCFKFGNTRCPIIYYSSSNAADSTKFMYCFLYAFYPEVNYYFKFNDFFGAFEYLGTDVKYISSTSGGSGSGGGSSTLSGLTDVSISSLSSNQVLKYNGVAWVNAEDSGLTSFTSSYWNVTTSENAVTQSPYSSKQSSACFYSGSGSSNTPDGSTVLNYNGYFRATRLYGTRVYDNGNRVLTSIPAATDSAIGGIQIGYTTTARNIAVELDSNKAFVNVPMTNTDTTYIAGTSSSISDITNSDYTDWVADTVTDGNSYCDITINGVSTIPTDGIIVRFTTNTIISGTKRYCFMFGSSRISLIDYSNNSSSVASKYMYSSTQAFYPGTNYYFKLSTSNSQKYAYFLGTDVKKINVSVTQPNSDFEISKSYQTYITVGGTDRKIKLPTDCPWLSGSWADATASLGGVVATLSIKSNMSASGSVSTLPRFLLTPGNAAYVAFPVIMDKNGNLFVALPAAIAAMATSDSWIQSNVTEIQ